MNTELELLMPGGSLDKIKYAITYGADAVYAGVPRYSLRARENEFFDGELVQQAVDFVHSHGKKIYLTCNIYAHNNKINGFMSAMAEMMSFKPDAFIMTDPGLIALTKEKFPDAVIHLSTQANNTNWAQAKFWRDYGVKRVILARELNIDEIREIHENVPDLELEAFVHGSICMAYSGRCLLSNYLSYRDANQGTCSHTCRWGFKVNVNDKPGDDVVTDYIPLDGDFYLEERERPGEMMPVDEDEYGTYIMNSKISVRSITWPNFEMLELLVLKSKGATKQSITLLWWRALIDAVLMRWLTVNLCQRAQRLDASRGQHYC